MPDRTPASATYAPRVRPPDLEPFGEHAVRVVLDAEWADDLGGRVALSSALLALPGVSDALVGESHALVVTKDAPRDGLRESLAHAVQRSRGAALAVGADHCVEVIYDGADIDEIARTLGRAVPDVIALHASSPLRVSFLGFLPGFAYLRGVAPELASLPRRASPRPRVPAGSVAVAGGMSAIYPAASPGGWNLLGHAPAFDPFATALAVGDVVTFRAGSAPTPGTTRESEARGLGPALRIDRVAGIALVVDGCPRRRLRDGAPPGGPLVPSLARRAMHGAGNGAHDGIIERYGALTVTLPSGAPRTIADETGRAVSLRAGQSVELPWSGRGRAGYLAIEGGFDTPLVLGGRGTLLSIGRGGLEGRPLRRGDLVPLGEPTGSGSSTAPRPSEREPGAVLVAQRGPDLLDVEHARRALTSLELRVAHASDRTGTRLLPSSSLALRTRPARTAPTLCGAIQAPPSGELVVLGPDHPVTGGYPVVGLLPAAAQEALFAQPVGARVRLRIE